MDVVSLPSFKDVSSSVCHGLWARKEMLQTGCLFPSTVFSLPGPTRIVASFLPVLHPHKREELFVVGQQEGPKQFTRRSDT